jgi:hypothetical protein
MIVTPRFVFLHLHKSGGTFVNTCLMRFVPGAQQIGYHLPRKLIPSGWAHLPVLGLVRNPWSYYVSWYTFQTNRPQPNALYRIASDEGRLDFAGTINNLLQLGQDDRPLAKVMAVLPATYTNRGLNLPNFALEGIRGTRQGFYSFLHDYMYGSKAPAVVMGKLENLRTDLPLMLEQVDQEVTGDLREFIAGAAPLNASEHAYYPDHYDAATAKAVGDADAAMIDRYGYRFGN